MLLRRGTHGTIADVVVTGFDAPFDVRDATTSVDLRAIHAFGGILFPIAFPERGGGTGPLKALARRAAPRGSERSSGGRILRPLGAVRRRLSRSVR
jgi:hypothetical protein